MPFDTKAGSGLGSEPQHASQDIVITAENHPHWY